MHENSSSYNWIKGQTPQYGVGTVKTIAEKTAEIRFEDALRTLDPELSGLTAAEPSASISGLEVPLKQFVASAVEEVIGQLDSKSRMLWSSS